MKKLWILKTFFIAIFLFCFFKPYFYASGEVMFDLGKLKIPEFPAPKKPKDFEPPDWKDYPWHMWGKPETFDINQPDAAAKIVWRARDNFWSGYCADGPAYWGDANRFGHIRSMVGTLGEIHHYGVDYQDILSYNEGKVNAGDTEYKSVVFNVEPSQIRGLANLEYKYLETPSVKKEIDRWLYIPALRRTRRLAAGADDDKLVGTDITVDDLGSREVWEEEYVLIGTDQLGPEEHSFYQFKAPKYPIRKKFGLKYNPYLPEKFDCWVILGVNTKPKYYFPKRITWYDKKTFLPVREEQYDSHGNLWKIYEWGYENYNYKYKAIPPQKYVNKQYGIGYTDYWQRQLWNVWDVKIDHRTFVFVYLEIFDEDTFFRWKGMGSPPDAFFDVKRLEREEWGTSEIWLPGIRIKSLKDYVPRPRLLRDKFKPFRKIMLPVELEKKLLEEWGE